MLQGEAAGLLGSSPAGRLSAHFQLAEFRCRCGSCGWPPGEEVRTNLKRLAQRLEGLRADLGGHPVTVTSGYRCLEHNRRVGGARRSRHLSGEAADIRVRGRALRTVARRARALAVGGVGLYRTHVHVDIRTGRRAVWSGPGVQPGWAM